MYVPFQRSYSGIGCNVPLGIISLMHESTGTCGYCCNIGSRCRNTSIDCQGVACNGDMCRCNLCPDDVQILCRNCRGCCWRCDRCKVLVCERHVQGCFKCAKTWCRDCSNDDCGDTNDCALLDCPNRGCWICRHCSEGFAVCCCQKKRYESGCVSPQKCETCRVVFCSRLCRGLSFRMNLLRNVFCTKCAIDVGMMFMRPRDDVGIVCKVEPFKYPVLPEKSEQPLIKVEAPEYKEIPNVETREVLEIPNKRREGSPTSSKPEKSFECPFCGKIFRTKGNMVVHTRTHTGEKRFRCEHCFKRFSERHNLQSHIRSHTGEKPYLCDICNKAFARQNNLTRHKLIHSDVKPFECLHCHDKFGSKSNLKSHLRIHGERILHHCAYCQKSFKSTNYFKKHTKKHEQDHDPAIHKPSTSKIIPAEKGRSAPTKTGELFECPYCEKMFGYKGNMIVHTRMHTGEKRFQCSHCLKRFSKRQNLQSHVRSHTGEKPYVCDICKKAFARQNNLIRHKLIHSKSKPFTCSSCQKKFVSKSNMRSHAKIHGERVLHHCEYCRKSFKSSNYFKKHIQKHKNDGDQSSFNNPILREICSDDDSIPLKSEDSIWQPQLLMKLK